MFFMNIKRNICICVVILFILICGIMIFIKISREKPVSKESDIQVLNHNDEFNLYIYGDSVSFDSSLKYHSLEKMDLESIDLNYDYVYLILCDLDGKLDLSKDDIIELSKFMEENTNFNYLYVGTSALKVFEQEIQDVSFNAEDAYFGYVWMKGAPSRVYGYITQEDIKLRNDTIDDELISQICRFIRWSKEGVK